MMKRTRDVFRCFLLALEIAVLVAMAQQLEVPPRSPSRLNEEQPASLALPAPRHNRAQAHESIITTFAGTDWLFQADGAPALNSPLSQVDQLSTDQQGNILIADPGNHVVSRLNADGALIVLAGNGIAGFSGNGGLARNASLFVPRAAVMDSSGNLFIADQGNHCIRRVTRDGIISVYAGTAKGGFAGDGGPATSASLNFPSGLALDRVGNLFIVDAGNSRIRRVARDGTISTYAGNGQAGYSGDGGPAIQAALRPDRGLAVDGEGNLYISDFGNSRVRRVTPAGTITTFAGNGSRGSGGDNGPAVNASITNPDGLAFDQSGNLFVADYSSSRVRKISRDGIITTVAGQGGPPGFSGDGGPALSAQLSTVAGLAVDATGRLYVADNGNSRIRRIDQAGRISTVAGNGGFRNASDGTPAASAFFTDPEGIAFDSAGNLLVSDAGNLRLRRIGRDGAFRTIAGSGVRGCCVPGPALNDLLGFPTGIVADRQGNIFFSDYASFRVRRLSPEGTITTYAGTGEPGFGGDGGPATDARLGGPIGLALDQLGNLYIADAPNHRIRRVSPDGEIRTFAGNGVAGFSGDGEPATDASLRQPNAVALDHLGNLLIADWRNNRIRAVSSGGIISIIAGVGAAASGGDGGPAEQASLNGPVALALDAAGNIFVAEVPGHRIRRISADGIISTVAGNGSAGFSGDGGPATLASLNTPVDLALDALGNLYIADAGNNRIRVVPVAQPAFDIVSPPLSFSGRAGGAAPPAQRFVVNASVAGAAFEVSADSERGDWLQVSPREGGTPRLVDVTADPGKLVPGKYRGGIVIRMADAQPALRRIPVLFTVEPGEAPQLTLDKESLSFPLPRGAESSSRTLTVSNVGGGILSFSASSSTSSGGDWLAVSPASASVSPSSPAVLNVTINPTGLGAGTYTGKIAVTGDGGSGSSTIPVKLMVSALDRAILLSQTGLTFTAVAGGGAPPPQTFAVLNAGRGVASWVASASTLAGGGAWLGVSPPAGATDAASGAVPSVEVRVNPSGLAPGDYYGQVRVDSPGAANTPQTVTVFLEVLPPESNPGPAVEPSELVFEGVAGAPSPSSKEIRIYNLTASAESYRSTVATENGANWIVHLPRDATLGPEGPTRLVVQPVTGNLAPGVYRSNLALQFSDGAVRNVSLVFIVSPSGAAAASAAGADGPCTASNLVPVLSSLGQSFNVSAGWPVALIAEVRDDCGVAVDSGEVVASFTNGDPPQPFTSLKNGTWHGTWKTGAGGLSKVTIKIQAQDRRHITGSREISGDLRSRQELPVVNAAGVVSAASFAPYAPLAPGGLISISGQRLAEGRAAASEIPLPIDVGGTEVLIAGRLMPLLSVSENRIDAIVPFGLEVNTAHQVLVQRGATLSQPLAIDVAAAQPAIFVQPDSAPAQGSIYVLRAGSDGQSRFLAQPGTPAQPGDRIVILCAGMGAVEDSSEAGSIGPEEPRVRTKDPVSVTVGGADAPVSFAGLAPGLVGLYQVEASVPQAAPRGDQVEVVLQIAGQTSPPATMAIE